MTNSDFEPVEALDVAAEFEVSPEFLQIGACPACHSKFAVDYDNHELVCTSGQCGLAYPVRDGIPVLLIDEARNPSAS